MYMRGAQKLMGDGRKVVWDKFFNFKFSVMSVIARYRQVRPYLDLKFQSWGLYHKTYYGRNLRFP
jgi:hypothetical protein